MAQIVVSDGGSGSGFIIDEDGLVVTNEHVVKGYGSATLRVEGRRYIGRTLGVDADADLALVQIQSSAEFTPVEMGDSDSVAVGDDVTALGFPMGSLLGGSLTTTRGIVSAKSASVSGLDRIQTDAAIHPGSGGGPLLNSDSEVVGVNTGGGFALAINEVKDRLDALRSGDSIEATATPMAGSQGSFRTYSNAEITLRHNDDGKTSLALADVRNFMITADFEVPYSSDTGAWDVGFIFRNAGRGNLQYVSLNSSGDYAHWLRINYKNTQLASGVVPEWNLQEGMINEVTLIAIEDRGWLAVNSTLIAEIDTSAGSESGSLEIATGLYEGFSVSGERTLATYVWAEEVGALFGPDSGGLTNKSRSIATIQAGLDLAWGYASAVVEVERDIESWSLGILFRREDEEDYLQFAVDNFQIWWVDRATYSGEGSRVLEEGYSAGIDLKDPEDFTDRVVNWVEAFFLGKVAYMYVNGELLDMVDISSVSNAGDVQLAYGIFPSDRYSTAQYEDFTVWGTQ